MKPTKWDALRELAPNSKFVTDSDGVITNHTLKNGDKLPTESKINTKLASMISEYNALQYQRDRQYPSIGDQLDMQYHDQLDGTTTWKDAIAKVKSDNPKE
tara:strand:- start:596 stop:898 length:303 start_codon:yes stop_codon:yes gene_type:complete